MNARQLTLPLDDPGLDSFERAVWAVIRSRHGRENAISVRALAAAVGLDPSSSGDERRVRKTIERLIKVYGLPIGSSCNPRHHGYYHITDPNELREHYEFLVRVAIRYLTRASRLQRGNLDRLVGQLELELEKGNGA